MLELSVDGYEAGADIVVKVDGWPELEGLGPLELEGFASLVAAAVVVALSVDFGIAETVALD